jgi:hypothetical protein
MIGLKTKSLRMATLGVGAILIAGAALAGGKPPPLVLCHNIGGPRDLGANCEATGNCTFILPDGSTVNFTENQFLGIVIGAESESAIAAHIRHGDGLATGLYDPPLHLASVVGPHKESNVECVADRVNPQPPEPGNYGQRRRPAVQKRGGRRADSAPHRLRRASVPDAFRIAWVAP